RPPRSSARPRRGPSSTPTAPAGSSSPRLHACRPSGASFVSGFGGDAIKRYPGPLVFDALSSRLGTALGDLRKRGKLDDESISRAMREIRLALLEADVNLDVVRDFTARVRERATGQAILH